MKTKSSKIALTLVVLGGVFAAACSSAPEETSESSSSELFSKVGVPTFYSCAVQDNLTGPKSTSSTCPAYPQSTPSTRSDCAEPNVIGYAIRTTSGLCPVGKLPNGTPWTAANNNFVSADVSPASVREAPLGVCMYPFPAGQRPDSSSFCGAWNVAEIGYMFDRQYCFNVTMEETSNLGPGHTIHAGCDTCVR